MTSFVNASHGSYDFGHTTNLHLRYDDDGEYCKTLYFSCILIWRFRSVELSLNFNLAFCQGVLCNVKFHVTSHVN